MQTRRADTVIIALGAHAGRAIVGDPQERLSPRALHRRRAMSSVTSKARYAAAIALHERSEYAHVEGAAHAIIPEQKSKRRSAASRRPSSRPNGSTSGHGSRTSSITRTASTCVRTRAPCRWSQTAARKSGALTTVATWMWAPAGKAGVSRSSAGAIEGDQIISRWVNRGPGKRPDGSYYETHGVSFITYGGRGQVHVAVRPVRPRAPDALCDELEEAGLLDPKLKQEWVLPVKKRLIEMLSKGLPK